MGDYQKRDDLLSHPQVESILFITKNNLTELFHPQLVKEFGLDGTCTIKLAGVIGKTLENYSIISIAASEALSDVLTFWTEENLNNFAKGEKIPKNYLEMKQKKKELTTNLGSHPYTQSPFLGFLYVFQNFMATKSKRALSRNQMYAHLCRSTLDLPSIGLMWWLRIELVQSTQSTQSTTCLILNTFQRTQIKICFWSIQSSANIWNGFW